MADDKQRLTEMIATLKAKEASGDVGKGLSAQRKMAQATQDYIREMKGLPPIIRESATAAEKAVARVPASGARKLFSMVPGLGLGLAAVGAATASSPSQAAESLVDSGIGAIPGVGTVYNAISPEKMGDAELTPEQLKQMKDEYDKKNGIQKLVQVRNEKLGQLANPSSNLKEITDDAMIKSKMINDPNYFQRFADERTAEKNAIDDGLASSDIAHNRVDFAKNYQEDLAKDKAKEQLNNDSLAISDIAHNRRDFAKDYQEDLAKDKDIQGNSDIAHNRRDFVKELAEDNDNYVEQKDDQKLNPKNKWSQILNTLNLGK